MKNSATFLFCCTFLAMTGMWSAGLNLWPGGETDFSPQRCAEPLTWQMGMIDPRFDIDSEIVKSIMAEAGNLWSDAVGTELIIYSDSGRVKLNFIYGDEQKYTDSERELSSRIDRMKLEYTAMEQDYQQVYRNYQTKLIGYNTTDKEHLAKADKYNNTMARWVDNGVFPREEKEQLKNLKKEMTVLQNLMEQKLSEINTDAQKMNELSFELDVYSNQVNKLIFQYKDRFGSEETFHQGLYTQAGDQRKINIYQFDNIDKLRLVLAHEIGHALGLGHTDNPKSIMHFKMEKQNEKNLQLTKEDSRAIAERCAEKPGTIR